MKPTTGYRSGALAITIIATMPPGGGALRCSESVNRPMALQETYWHSAFAMLQREPGAIEMHPSQSGKMLETVRMFLDEMGLKYEGPEVEQHDSGEMEFLILSAIDLEHARFNIQIHGDDSGEVIAFHVNHPTKAPVDRQSDIAEFITRINRRLWIGNLAMDYDDGEVSFKTSIGTEGITLGYSVLHNLLFNGLIMMRGLAPALERVMTGELSPEQAVAEVDAQRDAEAI